MVEKKTIADSTEVFYKINLIKHQQYFKLLVFLLHNMNKVFVTSN